MYSTIKKIFMFCDDLQSDLKKSLFYSLFNGIFASFQFMALYYTVLSISTNTINSKNIIFVFTIMFISIIGRIFASNQSMNLQTKVGYGMVSKKRIQIGNRLRYMPLGFFNKTNTGKLTGILTTTLSDVESSAPIVLVNVVGGFINSIILVIWLLIFKWQLGLVALCGISIFLVVTQIATNQSTKRAYKRQNTQRVLIESVIEFIKGMSVVKSYGMENEGEKSIHEVIKESNENNLKLVQSLVPFVAMQGFVIGVVTVLMILMSIYLYLNQNLLLAHCILFIIYSFLMFQGIASAGSQVTMLQMLAASIDTTNEVDRMPIMDENTKDITPKSHDIKFDNVSFSYDQRKILDHISFTIPQKTTTAIIGPSGSGKSTICNLIARFWDVSEGKITIGDIDIREYSLDSLMKNISMVFQNVYLFEDTIENNIKFGSPNATKQDMILAAKKACCHDFIMALPDGYNTLIGEGGATLSGGQKQRISIARAMLKDAPIVILDEATSSVDPENELELISAINELTHNKTIIMIAHKLQTVKKADQILVINNKNIEQIGTHEMLILQDGIYRNFYNQREKALGWKLG